MRSLQWPQTLSSFAKDTNYSAVVFMRDESKPLQSARQFITFIFPVFPANTILMSMSQKIGLGEKHLQGFH
jgi:hypothetical protein